MVDAGVRSRLGIEWLWLDSQRPVALQSGTSIDSGGSMLSLEWRLRFF